MSVDEHQGCLVLDPGFVNLITLFFTLLRLIECITLFCGLAETKCEGGVHLLESLGTSGINISIPELCSP